MSKGNRSKIDNLGRIVIPKSIRKALDVEANSEISMYVEDKKLIITKGLVQQLMTHLERLLIKLQNF